MNEDELAQAFHKGQTAGALVMQRLMGAVFDTQLDPMDVDGTFPAYRETALRSLRVGHMLSGQLAADYYKQARAAAGLTPTLPPGFTLPMLDEKAAAVSLHVTGPATIKRLTASGSSPAQAAASARVATLSYTKRAVLSGGRSTVLGIAARDTDAIGWARVSDGKPCAFCAMLISRGPVYSRETVGFRAHDNCGCVASPRFKTSPDGGWTPQARALQQLWMQTGSLDRMRDAMPAYYRTLDRSPAGTLPAWRSEHAAIVSKLPSDWRDFGFKDKMLSPDELCARATETVLHKAGVDSLDQLKQGLAAAEKQAADWRYVLDQIKARGLQNASTWPPEVQAMAQAAGLGGYAPSDVYRELGRALFEQEGAIAQFKRIILRTQLEIEDIKDAALKWPPSLVKVPDIDDATGLLGSRVQDALDNIRAAGKVIDDEVTRRMIATYGERPNIAAAMDNFTEATWVKWNTEYSDPRYAARAALAKEREAEFDRTIDALRRWDSDRSTVTRQVLGEVRGLGGTGADYTLNDWNTPGGLIDAMKGAESFYPSDWLAAYRREFPSVELSFESRGFTNPGRPTITLSDRGGQGFDGVALHELGHKMEGVVPGMRPMEWAYRYTRSTAPPDADGVVRLMPTEEIYAGNLDTRFGPEICIPDNWPEKYSGKQYGEAGPDAYWELFTTGVESVLQRGEYLTRPDHSIDVDFRQFILGVLSGL